MHGSLSLFYDLLNSVVSKHAHIKVVRHIEMPKAAPKKSICNFQKLEMILK